MRPVVTILVGLCVTATGCGPTTPAAKPGSAATSPRFGGEIRVAINSDILSTNPGVRRDGNTDTVMFHLGEPLVAYRDDMSIAPMLAESVSLSPDRRAYSFVLRRGVRFHNGAILTARDVKWTWTRLLDPKTGFRCLDDFDGSGATGVKIEAIETPDEHRVVFRLNKPSALFLDRMASIQCQTSIMHRSSIAADGGWLKPVGTGPYRLGEWRRGQFVVIERFAGYTPRAEPATGLTGRKIAYADRIRFVVTPDRLAAKSSLYAGSIDLLFAAPLSAMREMQRREARESDVRLHRQETLDWTVMLMQTDDPLLKDVKLRRAIAHAISPELITEVSTFGLSRPNSSAVIASSRYRVAGEGRWLAYDPALARRLAKEAGYAGQPIVIQTNRKFPYMFDNAIAAQAMLNAAGFNAKIEVFDWATQLSNFQKGRFQISSFGYASRSHPAMLYGNFTGSKTVRKSYQWDDPRAIALIEELDAAPDDEALRDAMARLHELMLEDVPLIGLYNDSIIDLTRTSIHGYRPWAVGRPRLWGVWKDTD